jgi:hypothetical protein
VWPFVHARLNPYQGAKDALQYGYPRIAPAAGHFIEEYGFVSYVGVKEAADEFCEYNACRIISLPSGQGVIIKNEY